MRFLWVWGFVALVLSQGLATAAFGESDPSSAGAPLLEDYLRETEVRGIALSPDGRRLALIKRFKEDVYRLYILDLDDGNKVVAAHREPEGQSIVGTRWLNNERIAVTLAGEKTYRGYDYGYRRLMILSWDGSKAHGVFHDQRQLTDNLNLARVISVLPGDPDHILMLAIDNTVSLYKVNIHNGTSHKVVGGSTRTFWYAVNSKGEPTIRFDYFYRSRKIVLYLYDLEKEKWKKATSFRLKNLDEELEKYLANYEGDTTVLMLDRLEEDEYTKLYRYDIKTGEHLDVRFELDNYDIAHVIKDRNTEKVLGVSHIEDREIYTYFDEDMQAVQSRLEEQLVNGEVAIFYVSADKNRYLIYYSEPWRRGVYLVYNRDTDQLYEIADVAPQIQKSSTTSVDTIRYRAKDETMIHGYLTFPEGRQTEMLPLIVFPHGGPHVRDWLSYDIFVQYWATRGYAVFQPNFRGSSGTGRSFEDLGNKEYGGEMIEDVASGIRALIRAGRADPDRVCAAGISYGGYAASMLAIKSDLLKCAVSINGVTDYTNQIKEDLKNTKDKDDRAELRVYFDETIGNIDTEKDRLISESPLHRVSEIEVPYLLIHAEDDGNVDFQNAKKMQKALKRSNKKDFEFMPLKCGGHSLHWCGATEDVLRKTEQFFHTHIGGPDIAAPGKADEE